MTNNVDFDMAELNGADDLLSKLGKKSKHEKQEKDEQQKPVEKKQSKGQKVGRKPIAEEEKKKSITFAIKPETLSKIEEVGKYLEKEEFRGMVKLSRGSVIDILAEQFYKEKIASKES